MTTWHVAADAGGGGNGTLASPFTLNEARTGASGAIVAGDTVTVASGVYSAINGYNFTLSGASGNPVSFVADGDVVIDGAYSDVVWELHDASTSTYRTAGTTYGNAEQSGHIQLGGTWYPLITHGPDNDLGCLMASSQVYSASGDHYLGPGIAEQYNDGRIYIRLVAVNGDAQLGRTCPTISDVNPANNTIKLCSAQKYGIIVTGDHLTFDGFTINDFYSLVQVVGDGCSLSDITGRFGQIAVRVGADIVGLTIADCTFDGRLDSTHWWGAWGDMKNGRTIADGTRKAGLSLGSAAVSDVLITGCTIRNVFDGILAEGGNDMRVTGCTFDHCWDDAWQMYSNLYDIEFDNNVCLGAGPSHDGSGGNSPNADPGTVYIHHNIIDTTTKLILWGRDGTAESGNTEGFGEAIALSTHGQPAYAHPWKFYNNTVVTGADRITATLQSGLFLTTSANQSVETHDVYNNIFVAPSAVAVALVEPGANERYGANVYSGVTPAQIDAAGITVDPALDADYLPATNQVLAGAVDLSGSGWPGVTSGYRGAVAGTPSEASSGRTFTLLAQ